MELNQIIKQRKERDQRERERDKDRDRDFSSPDVVLDIVVYEPKIYEDSLNISGSLRKGKPIIINLKHLPPNEGTRLIDFICGAAYAIDGHMMKIGESIFLFAPRSVRLVDAEERESSDDMTSVDGQKDAFFSNR